MKKIGFLLVLATFSNLYAQNVLKFDKRNTLCENKWVAYPMSKDSTYAYGFIYIDEQAGLSLNYEAKFKIDKKGNFIKIVDENQKTAFIKYRLEPNKMLIALIPESKFKDLNIQAEPDWLKHYKKDDNSVEKMYRWGFLYNSYGEYEIALNYLENALEKDPSFKGLLTELSFSYNALNQYEKAEKLLLLAIKKTPNDCYTLKELAYTYKNLKKFENSADTFKKMAEVCDNKFFVQETAYNLAYEYFQAKDKKNFNKWNKEARKWSDKENRYTKALDELEKSINQ